MTTILSDLDGTLASNLWRAPFVVGDGRKDWDTYFLLSQFDAPIEPVVERVRRRATEGGRVIIATGRPEDHRALAEQWLTRHRVPCDELLMRPTTDYRSDAECKRDMLPLLPLADIDLVLDDRPATIAVWREAGLPVEICQDPRLAPLLPGADDARGATAR